MSAHWLSFADVLWWTGVAYTIIAYNYLYRDERTAGLLLGGIALFDLVGALHLDNEHAPWGDAL